MGPSAPIKALRFARHPPALMDRYIQDRTQANMLKQVRGSLPVTPSALNCYTVFCELRGASPFPSTEPLVIEWGAVFSDTATCATYISHMQKVCFFARAPANLMAPAVRRAAKGLKKCQYTRFRFPNFIRSDFLLRLLNMEKISSEFAKACAISFIFAFRAPSETRMTPCCPSRRNGRRPLSAFALLDVAAFWPISCVSGRI